MARNPLFDELERLKRENIELRKEVLALRNAPRPTVHRKCIELAYLNALQLAAWHIAGLATSYRAITQESPRCMSQVRWRQAVALAEAARVHDGEKFLTRDQDTILTRLQTVRQKCYDVGVGYLYARLPKSYNYFVPVSRL